MLYIILGILAVLAVLLGIAVIRTLMIKAPEVKKCETEISPEEIEIAAKHILKTKERLNKILAENTGKPIDQIAKDTDRDNWLSAEEAVEYGLVDKVLKR